MDEQDAIHAKPKPRVWSHLLNESLMENFIFCAVLINFNYLTQKKGNIQWMKNDLSKRSGT